MFRFIPLLIIGSLLTSCGGYGYEKEYDNEDNTDQTNYDELRNASKSGYKVQFDEDGHPVAEDREITDTAFESVSLARWKNQRIAEGSSDDTLSVNLVINPNTSEEDVRRISEKASRLNLKVKPVIPNEK